jgi:alpha-galactosidase
VTSTSAGPKAGVSVSGPVWKQHPYVIKVEKEAAGGAWVQVAESREPFAELMAGGGALGSVKLTEPTGGKLRLTICVPLLNYARVVIPDCGRHYVNSSKGLDIRAGLFRVTAPNVGHPFFALMSEAGPCMFAFGLLDADGAMEIKRVLPVISQRKAMVGGDEHLGLAFEWTPKKAVSSVPIYMTRQQTSWFEALREYTGAIEKAEGISQPHHPDAWRPVWCTWTAFPSAEMTQERVLANARIGKKLGIGTIILDDGWFGPGLDDDFGAPHQPTINHGDYYPDPVKLPDLPGLVKRVQGMGLKFLLWHAPLCVAPEAKVATKLKKLFQKKAGADFLSVNGMHQLCPCNKEVRDYAKAETYRLFKEFGVDGLKVDLYNCLSDQACDSKDHAHDIDDPVRGVDAVMAAVWAGALEARADAIMELKQDYGNVRLARHGTMVRAGDTAYDMDTNNLRCSYTQAFARCVHVDPVVTSVHTEARHMAILALKSVALGVPTYSMDLERFTDEQLAPIGHWLGFYNDHVEMFMAPRKPLTLDQDVWAGGVEGSKWVAVLRQARVMALPEGKRVHVMNGTFRETILLEGPTPVNKRIKTFDAAGKGVFEGVLPAGSREINIPMGGRAELTAG